MTSPVAIGLSCCYLLHACERVRDFDRAAQWCHRVREFCERTRFNFLLAVCRIQYAGVLAWRGAWAEAEQELLAAVRHFGADRPVLRREGLVRLADLRRQQGRFEEAAALLTEVEVHPLAVLGQAALALDRSEPAAAARLAQRFLRRVPAANRTDRLAALDVLLRARIALGQVREARGVLDELRETDVAVATDPLKAGVLVAEGIVAEAEGARDRAREALEDAIDLLAQSGGSFEVARCRVELARVLAALGHAAEADAALREACLVFEQLGAAAHAAAATALRRDLAAAPRAPDRDPALARLTRREVDVLRLLAQGLSNRAIAARLIVSEFTVKRHVANLLAKLEVPSRAAAAARAARHGLV
ncbi:MAG: hypothetical protein HY615_15535 [Candidatus Rokubacteria bacterium]|nr:hypothetical protein [Candidatus Rokubacteria bacterium]